jgi:hypothetical protein
MNNIVMEIKRNLGEGVYKTLHNQIRTHTVPRIGEKIYTCDGETKIVDIVWTFPLPGCRDQDGYELDILVTLYVAFISVA